MRSGALNRRSMLRALTLGGLGVASETTWMGRLCEVALARGASTMQSAETFRPRVLTPHQNETVIHLSELIIPQTDTAGAEAAQVNQFIDAVLVDAGEGERDSFLEGLEWLDRRSQELFGADFISSRDDQQTALLTLLSSENNQTTQDQMGVTFFQAMKSLTVTGYYTSEIGAREELGDDGSVFFQDDPGCRHPEHQAPLERDQGRG